MKRHFDEIEGAHRKTGYVYSFHYHFIFPTKYRRKLFVTEDMVNDISKIFENIASASDVTLESIEIKPDYAHIVLSFKPKYAPSEVVKVFKGLSARALFKVHPELKDDPFYKGKIWADNYFVFTSGTMGESDIQRYMHNQFMGIPGT